MKVKQVCNIQTKLNYFKNYCFSMGIRNFDTFDYLLLKYMRNELERNIWRDRLLGSQKDGINNKYYVQYVYITISI